MRTGRATSNRSQGKAGHNLQISHSYLLWLMGPLVTLMKSCTYDILHSVSMGHVPTEFRDLGLKKKKKKAPAVALGEGLRISGASGHLFQKC